MIGTIARSRAGYARPSRAARRRQANELARKRRVLPDARMQFTLAGQQRALLAKKGNGFRNVWENGEWV